MFFTKDDYLKIENWLKSRAVKDSDFKVINSIYGTSGDNYLVILQDNENKRIKIDNFLSDIISQDLGNALNKTISQKGITDSLTELTVNIPIEKGIGVDSVIQKGGSNVASGDYSFAVGISTEAIGNTAHSEGNSTTASGENSHAEGLNTTASGDNSHTEGYKSVASGLNSHSEGYNTAANNTYSHSEGGNTISNGKGSHAEGYNTLADNNHSHAEGFGTKAYSLGSHAEGFSTVAGIKNNTSECSYSHAEGHSTQATGQYSHTEGYQTQAVNSGEHSEGIYNKSISGKTIHTVGIGASEVRKNAHEIHNDGKHYIYGIGGYDGTNSQTEGVKTLQEVIADIPVEKGEASGSFVQKSRIGAENKAISENSVALGSLNIAGTKAYKWNAINFNTKTITLVDTPSGIVTGDRLSIINNSHYDDCCEVVSVSGKNIVVDSLPFTVIESDSGEDAQTIFVVSKPNVGNVDIGQCAFAEGGNTMATQMFSHAEGYGTKAIGQYSHSEGRETKAGYIAHAEGSKSKAIGNASHAEGTENIAANSNSHVEGRYTKATGYAAHAEGYGESLENPNLAQGDYSHVEGEKNKALGIAAHSEGGATVATGSFSHSEGRFTRAHGLWSHVEGCGVEGDEDNYGAFGPISHCEGYATRTFGGANSAHAEGRFTEASNMAEHACGIYNKSTKSSDASQATHFSIGIGTSNTNRKNAVEVKQNGDVYIVGIGSYQGTTISGATPLANFINSVNDRVSELENSICETLEFTLTEEHVIENGELREDMYKLIETEEQKSHNLPIFVKMLNREISHVHLRVVQMRDNETEVYFEAIGNYNIKFNTEEAESGLVQGTSNFEANSYYTILVNFTKNGIESTPEIGGGYPAIAMRVDLQETIDSLQLKDTELTNTITALQAEVAALKAIINEITIKE